VSSSWTWNLLSFVFIPRCFTFCSCLTARKYRTERHTEQAKMARVGAPQRLERATLGVRR
jgi:hypothetical protein